MINALAEQQLRPDPVIPGLLGKLLLSWARHEIDQRGVPQLYYPIACN